MLDILKKHFSVNLNDYSNINVDLEINKVVLGAFIALIAGVIVLNVYRGNIRLVIMQLMRHNAKDEESAKTLCELGLDKSHAVKKALSKRNVLTRTVTMVGAVEYDYETYKGMSKEARAESEKIDFDSARFYLDPEETYRAEFIIERYNTSIIRTAVICLFFAILCVCTIACMPGILNVVNSLLEKIKH